MVAGVLDRPVFIELRPGQRIADHIEAGVEVAVIDIDLVGEITADRGVVSRHVDYEPAAVQLDGVPHVALIAGKARHPVDVEAGQRAQQVEGVGIALAVGLAIQ